MFPAERIELLREERGITQKQLAAEIHVSSSSISEYEKGNIQPSTTVLLALADFFHVNLDYLLGRTSIRIPINRLEEDLITKSGKIPIDTLFQLSNDDKEAIGLMLLALKKRK